MPTRRRTVATPPEERIGMALRLLVRNPSNHSAAALALQWGGHILANLTTYIIGLGVYERLYFKNGYENSASPFEQIALPIELPAILEAYFLNIATVVLIYTKEEVEMLMSYILPKFEAVSELPICSTCGCIMAVNDAINSNLSQTVSLVDTLLFRSMTIMVENNASAFDVEGFYESTGLEVFKNLLYSLRVANYSENATRDSQIIENLKSKFPRTVERLLSIIGSARSVSQAESFGRILAVKPRDYTQIFSDSQCRDGLMVTALSHCLRDEAESRGLINLEHTVENLLAVVLPKLPPEPASIQVARLQSSLISLSHKPVSQFKSNSGMLQTVITAIANSKKRSEESRTKCLEKVTTYFKNGAKMEERAQVLAEVEHQMNLYKGVDDNIASGAYATFEVAKLCILADHGDNLKNKLISKSKKGTVLFKKTQSDLQEIIISACRFWDQAQILTVTCLEEELASKQIAYDKLKSCHSLKEICPNLKSWLEVIRPTRDGAIVNAGGRGAVQLPGVGANNAGQHPSQNQNLNVNAASSSSSSNVASPVAQPDAVPVAVEVVNQPDPVVAQAPEVVNTAPEVVQPAPVAVQAAPEPVQAAPVVAQAPSVAAQPAPVVAQAPPVVAQAPPVAAQAPPVVAQAPPVVAQPPPVVEQAASVVTQAPPVVFQPPPVVAQAPPVVAQAPPVVVQPPPVAAQAAPVATQAPPVAAQAVPPVPLPAKSAVVDATKAVPPVKAPARAPKVAKNEASASASTAPSMTEAKAA